MDYKTKLLYFHMQNCKSQFIFGHAIIAGKLAKKEYDNFDKYKIDCITHKIRHGSKEQFNTFMGIRN